MADVRQPAPGRPVIELEKLTRQFGDFVAVDDVSFAIAARLYGRTGQ
jgi:ABC-type branched-subunit amino acid transport system ATPase component